MQSQQEKLMKELIKYSVYGPVATIYGSTNTGSWRLEKPSIDFDDCIKCGTCQRYCPTNVIEIKKDEKECVVIDFNYCKGCGICVNECPKKCMKMISERGEY